MEVNQVLVEKLANQIKQKITKMPEVAMILGSGLSGLVDAMKDCTVIPYEELEGMLIPHVQGHKNQVVIGELGGKNVIAMQGRFHAYDGFSAKECALPIYLFKVLGVKTVIITNSSGAVNENYDVGDLMLIKGHINLTGMNPLIGGAIIDSGVEFVDLKEVYDKSYRNIMKELAKKHDIVLQEGVFLQDLGPSYETPAEVKFFRTIGADAVSMSTVLEVIACAQCNLKVLGISCIANKAVSDENNDVLTHEEVLESGRMAVNKLSILLTDFVKQL